MATIQTFTSNGSWTCPGGVTSVIVECWGGGGGVSSPGNGVKRAGAGGGAYSLKTLSVTPGLSYNYYIGSAGANTGGNGGDTYWIDVSTAMAKGGTGNKGTNSAAGGLASASVGDTKYDGGDGAASGSTYGGGGGSGAGSTGAGNNASTYTGGTAKSENGGAGGNGRNGSAGVGNPGNDYGGGAGGAWRQGGTGKAGYAGAAGFMRITYDIPAFICSTRVGGVWKTVPALSVRIGGSWKPITAGYKKISSTWTRIF